MVKKWFTVLAFTLLAAAAYSQGGRSDSTIIHDDDLSLIDTTLDYDALFQDFDAFLDSILSPHSYFTASVAMNNGYFSFDRKNTVAIQTEKKLTYTPTLGYYHRNGLGITVTGSVINDGAAMNLYQSAISPSFDYVKNKKMAAGIAYTKFFTKDSLSFYTTPLQNEVYAYFTYRKWWVRPTLAMSYGWGSRSDYDQRESLIEDLRLRRRGFTYINTEETVRDFSVIASVCHDFYWLDVFTYKDHIRFSPQFSFTSGTQKFGFNQSSNTYATLLRNNSSVLYNSENVYLDDQLKFQPLSLTMILRGEYFIGKFFVQPQLAMDYYFPATSKNLSTIFSVNLGCIL